MTNKSIIEKKTLDGTTEYIDTATGQVIRRVWSKNKANEFNKRCSPDAIMRKTRLDSYIKEYGLAHGDNENGKYLTVYYSLRKDGKFLRMRTPAYKETIAIGFNSLDEAKRKAQELNAEVYTSSYPSLQLTIT